MGDLSDFQTGQIGDACLAAAFVSKMATFLGVPRASVSKVVMAYTNHGKTSSAQQNSGCKPKPSESECHTLKRTVSKNHRTAAATVTAELNIHLEGPVAKKSPMTGSEIQHPQYSCNC